MYEKIQISTANDLVKAFALLINNGDRTISETREFLKECVGNDPALLEETMTRISFQVDCLRFQTSVSFN